MIKTQKDPPTLFRLHDQTLPTSQAITMLSTRSFHYPIPSSNQILRLANCHNLRLGGTKPDQIPTTSPPKPSPAMVPTHLTSIITTNGADWYHLVYYQIDLERYAMERVLYNVSDTNPNTTSNKPQHPIPPSPIALLITPHSHSPHHTLIPQRDNSLQSKIEVWDDSTVHTCCRILGLCAKMVYVGVVLGVVWWVLMGFGS